MHTHVYTPDALGEPKCPNSISCPQMQNATLDNPYKSSVIWFKLAMRPFRLQLSRLEACVAQLDAGQHCTLIAYRALVGAKLLRETSELCDRIQGGRGREFNVCLDQSWNESMAMDTVVEAKDSFSLL